MLQWFEKKYGAVMTDLDSLISIVVPIYKTLKYLPQCIESVLAQTYTAWELILVDDGSPDECGILADRYAAEGGPDGQPVIVIHKENGGLSSARNAGLDAASGKYVMFLDSDDFLEKDFLKQTVTKAEEKQLDMVVTPTRNVSSDGEFAEDLHINEYWRTFGGKEFLIRYNVTPRIYRTQFLRDKALKFSDGELMEDVVFCLATNMLTERFELINYHGYCYRLNPTGIVGSFKKSGIPDNRIPYRGLRESIKLVRKYNGKDNDRILEYCVVRILVTILFVFCRKSDTATVRHMCSYTQKLLEEFFPDFIHNPYFSVFGEENVPRFQSIAVWLFKVLYRTKLLTPFALVYTRV
ncbi:MAG: glycosyltransferase family 2 protein [Clostridia bacterium]|nr:glycosyltransferase family 2 protein [Clostridia bacterium]